MEELQRLLQSLGQLTNASSAAAQSLGRISDSAQDADEGLEGLGSSLKGGVGKLLSFSGAMGALTNLVIRNVSVQIRLTKSITDLNTQIYKSEDVFASMTAKTEKSFEYMSDVVNTNTGGLRAFFQELPVIGDIFKSLEQVGLETMSLVQEQNKQNLAIVQTVSGGVRQLSSNFGVVTLNLTEFSAKAGEAGLNSDQFAKILSDNTANLSGAFGGVTDASNIMSQAFKGLITPGSGVEGLRDRFVALGMNTDDIAELFSETAIRQRILTGQQVQSGKALATQSFEYLKSLKGLSAITGEDLKTQQARRRDILNQANFAAKLEQLRAQERGAEADALFGGVNLTGQLFGASAQKLAMEVAVYGRAITQEGAMLAMSNKGQYEAIQEVIAGTKGFTGSIVEANSQNTAIFDAKKEEIQQSRDASNSLAMLSGLTDNQFVQTVGTMFVETRDAVERLGTLSENFNSSVGAMGSTLDTVTQQIIDQSRLDQKRRAELERKLLDERGGLAVSTVALAGAFGDMAYELTDKRLGLIEGITKTTNKFAEFVGDAGVDTFIALAKAVGVMAGDPETLEDRKTDALAAILGGAESAGTDAVGGYGTGAAVSRADGGIVTGPDTGYRATLHGTEAIVPLPDGKSIPVTLDTTKFDESITALVQGIGSSSNNDNSNLASLMEQSVNLNGQILDTLKQNNRTGKQMVRAIS